MNGLCGAVESNRYLEKGGKRDMLLAADQSGCSYVFLNSPLRPFLGFRFFSEGITTSQFRRSMEIDVSSPVNIIK